MIPYVQDADFTLLCCDVLDGLRSLADGSVHCVVTSPPYWGLRDYGTGEWEGGDPECDHAVGGQVQDTKAPGAITTGQRPGVDASACRKCGARRIDQQLGLEPTPDLYVARKHGRRSIGIELNESYCELAARRMQQQSLFA